MHWKKRELKKQWTHQSTTHKHTNTSREQEDPLTFSAVHVCPFTDHNWTPTDHYWTPTDHNRRTITRCPLTITGHPLTIITGHPLTITGHPLTTTGHPLTTIGHYPAMTGCPLTITGQTNLTDQAIFLLTDPTLSVLFPLSLPDMLNKPS